MFVCGGCSVVVVVDGTREHMNIVVVVVVIVVGFILKNFTLYFR